MASDLKLKYGASAALTITLASLAASNVSGRQSTLIDNTTNLFLDAHVGGKIKCGSNSMGAVIEVYAFGQIEDGGLLPDVLGATDANVTFTTRDSLLESCARLETIICDATTGRVHYIKPTSVASLFGGVLPFKWGVVVINNSGGALDSTGTNHALYFKPVYAQAV